MITRVRTLTFLPDIFQTQTNSQFLRAILDPLVQDKDLKKVEGYIGSKFGPGINANNSYIPEYSKTRRNYQLEPGVIFLKTNTPTPKDSISYPELIDSISNENGLSNNHLRLFTQDYVAWDSFINLDLLVNYAQYYWLPEGPRAVTVSGYPNKIDVPNDIIGKESYTSPNGVKFINGLKIIFNEFVEPSLYSGIEYYVEGVGTSIQLVTVADQQLSTRFSVPEYLPWSEINWDLGVWDIRLRTPKTKDYITINRGSKDRNAWSRSNQWFHISVIQATAVYTNTPDSVALANDISRAKRPIIEFYSDLRLFNSGTSFIPAVDFIDTHTTDAFSSVAGSIIYYPDIAAYTAPTATVISQNLALPESTAIISVPTADLSGPIYVNNYIGGQGLSQLANNAQITAISINGSNTIITIKWPDNNPIITTTNLELAIAPTPLVNYAIFDNARIIFTADTNPNVRNKVYIAQYDYILKRYNLVPDTAADVQPGSQTLILHGFYNIDYDYWFNGIEWTRAQQKYAINQEPLFDVYDNNGISFGDSDVYASSSFIGNKLFSYTRGVGPSDSVLGFPLNYTGNINNIGEITFTVNINEDSFNYVKNNITTSVAIKTGYVHQYSDYLNYTRKIGWVSAIAPSVQYQLFEIEYTAGKSPNNITLDIAANYNSKWPNVQLYYNNIIQHKFTYTTTENTTTIIFDEPTESTVIQILILSNQTSKNAYYVIPINLSKNPFNEDITNLTTSSIRYYFESIFNNSNAVSGSYLGINNYNNLPNLLPYGSTLVKHSASLVAPASLSRDNNTNLFNALSYNSREYLTYKNLLVYTVDQLKFDQMYTTAYMLDETMKTISDSRNNTSSFFWSDMLPNGTVYASNTYIFNTGTSIAIFPLSHVYDYSRANYDGVLVYVTKVIDGLVNQRLLVKNKDYIISDTESSLTVTADLSTGDRVTINEYNVTYGSYVPNTPTKLGLWPSTQPHVYTDTSLLNPATFIVGHDGSYTKIWGHLDADGNLVDFKDRVLLEFEIRIYNNLKLDGFRVLNPYEYLPGYWRENDYSYDEWLSIYSPQFLSWVGANKIDYKTQEYREHNEFTWNYRGSNVRDSGVDIDIGYWRELYEYMYDTSRPDIAPWEMLHYVDKPDWWDSRYGGLPYTSDNLMLWSELAAGYDWANGSPRIIETAIRKDLLQVIPVDTEGRLLSPFRSLVGNYLNNSFRKEWEVGDGGPAEYSYRRSSTWPFDFCRIVALQSPAKFYNLYIDVDNYRWNEEFKQYLVNNRGSLILKDMPIYGSGTPVTSYLNWIIDYCAQWGIDSTALLETRFENLDVRLLYRAAAFTDKDLLKFYVEKPSPQTTKNTLLIPDESYHILLHDNIAFDRINYSSVIVQRTPAGWRVYGNSQTIQTFKTIKPVINGNYSTIRVLRISTQLPNDYTEEVVYVPYGTEFTDYHSLCQFIANYGIALERSGCKFLEIEYGIPITWRQMIAELLYWIQSGWTVGSTLNINPAANVLTIDREFAIVQPLIIKNQNFVLNQNLYNIQNTDLNIFREDNLFSVATKNRGDTVAYAQFHLSNIEHVIIFDNITAFNDTIYNIQSGVRHNRIFMRGWLTDNWIGNLDANGFILNIDDVEEWNNSTTYSPGVIVTYRNRYYIARQIVHASENFDESLWRICNYDRIQKGLLPNSATRSTEAALYYDTNTANLENDADLLAFSLIGYRPRDYLYYGDIELTDITQINVYKNLIKQKGTALAAEYFDGTQFTNDTIQYNIHEIWSIKAYDFGGVLSDNFIEIRLLESDLTGNPTLIALKSNYQYPDVGQILLLSELHNYSRMPDTIEVLPTISSSNANSPYKSAGYVKFDDVTVAAYNYSDLNTSTRSIYDIYVGDYIWVAQFKSAWHVYTPVSIGYNDDIACAHSVLLVSVTNNGNGTAVFQFNNPHGLEQYEPFSVINFNNIIDGYYIVYGVIDLYRVYVTIQSLNVVTTISGSGIVLRYSEQRVARPSDISTMNLTVQEFVTNRVWVDTGSNGDWAVYLKRLNYQYESELFSTETAAADTAFGSAVATSKLLGVIVSDPYNATSGGGILYRYTYSTLTDQWEKSILRTDTSGYGRGMTHNENLLFVANPDDGYVDIWAGQYDPTYKGVYYITRLAIANNGVMAVSGDSRYLYIGNSTSTGVSVFDGTSNFDGIIRTTTLGNIVGTIIGNILTVTTISPGLVLQVNQLLVGPGIVSGTVITGFGTGIGGLGTYTVNISQTDFPPVNSITVLWSVLTVTNMNDGPLLQLGTFISGYDILPGTSILAMESPIQYQVIDIIGDGIRFTVTTDRSVDTWVAGSYVTISGSSDIVFDGNWLIETGDGTQFTVLSNIVSTAVGGLVIAIGTGAIGSYTVNSPITAYSTRIIGIRYSFVGTITDGVIGDNFGTAIATDYYGRNLVIGASGTDQATANNGGAAYYYNRLYQNWEYDGIGAGIFTATWVLTGASGVVVNNNLLHPAQYNIIGSQIQILIALRAGDIVSVNDHVYSLAQVLESPLVADGRSSYFGYSTASNRTGTEILVGAPGDIMSDNSEGAVYRYTNVGARLGTISGYCGERIVARTILLNGYEVILPPCIAADGAITAAAAIMLAAPNNIIATADNNLLIISLRNRDTATFGSQLSIIVPDSLVARDVFEELGISSLLATQTITNPHRSTQSQFGSSVVFNEVDSILVGAPFDNRLSSTTFDFIDSEDLSKDTIFDSNTTQFRDVTPRIGSAYIFDYLKNYDETIDNLGAFTYAQSVINYNNTISAGANFGKSIDFYNSVAVVGAPNFIGLSNTDGISSFAQVVIAENRTQYTTDWVIDRVSGAIVDISKVNSTHLYDYTTNTTLMELDHFDPLQGVLLGSVISNLDYISGEDPAQYNSPLFNINSTVASENNIFLSSQNQLLWAESHVGRLWFDTSRTLWVDYHQTDYVYNSKWWGKVFPGSDVAVYTWVSSSELPTQYSGVGTVYDIQRYVITYVTTATGNVVPRYYYWVRDTNVISTELGKTLSDRVLQAYIAAPGASGIAQFAPVLPNIYALVNCAEYIADYETILHIGFDTGISDDTSHISVELIRDDYKDDYLSGLPKTISEEPTALYSKWLNSMTGVDDYGNLVPNIYLPKKVQNGIANSPLQSMFGDRFAALQNYLEYVNGVLIQYPVRETKNPSLLFSIGENYDTTLYWEYVNWWAPGYNDNTLPSIQVQYYNDLELLNVPAGTVAKVLTNGIGLSEYWIYVVNSPGRWVRIGIENGTIQFLDILWDYTIKQVGWDGNSFDTTLWDEYPSIETQNCLRSINEQLLVDDLLIYRNRGLMVCFEYAATEMNNNGAYLPWLDKTSFIDVENNVRELVAFSTFRNDKVDFLSGYIKEVKPYHVTVRQFIHKYSVMDTVGMRYTDFDFPALFNQNTNSYISPQIAYVTPDGSNQFKLDDPIWLNDRYIDYRENWGISLTGRKNYVITTTNAAFDMMANRIPIKNPYSFPTTGVVTITNSTTYVDGWDMFAWDVINYDTGVYTDVPGEQIYYGGIDYENLYLTNVIRGYNNTIPQDFIEGLNVVIDLPGVILLQNGRYYTSTPNITVKYDTTEYPAPRREIQLQPIMSNGMVIGIDIIDAGSGYAVQPIIEVDPAFSLYPISIDPILNTLTFSTSSFRTGDKVQYNVGNLTLKIAGLIDGSYYYVGVISAAAGNYVIALYGSKHDAYLDQNRVQLFDSGSGIEHWFSYGAIVEPVMSNLPVREITTTFAWDRVKYLPTNAWNAGTYYAPAYNTTIASIKRPVIKIYDITTVGTSVARFIVGYDNSYLKPAHLNHLQVNYLTAPGNLGEPPKVKIGYLKLIDGDTVELYNDYNFSSEVSADNILLTGSVSTTVGVSNTKLQFVGTITGDTIVASSIGNTMTVTSSLLNGITVGIEISGIGIQPGTIVTSFITGVGGVGTYEIHPAQTFGVTTVTVGGNILNVTALNTPGVLSIGDIIVGSGIQPNTTILANGTGIGGLGTYIVDIPQLVETDTTIKIATDTLVCDSIVGFSVGDPVYFISVNNIPNLLHDSTYYITAVNTVTNEVTIGGLAINASGPGGAVMIGGTSYLYSRLPLNYAADRVLFNSTLYQCRLANNDLVFDSAKWIVVTQTEVDRIESYYSPTVNMIGKDITQLLAGVTYPNAVYSGSPFTWDGVLQLDTYLIDPAWPTNIVSNVVEGSSFNSGYAPEELLAGQFKELVNIYMNTSGAQLDFLLSIDAAGSSSVFNLNPSRITTTAAILKRINDETDILYLTDVNTVIYQEVYPVDISSGQVLVPTVSNILSVNVASWTAPNNITIQLGSSPYPATVTVTAGSILLVRYVDVDGTIKFEFIGFESVNTVTSSVTKLRRGLFNSPIIDEISAGVDVYMISPNNQLPSEYMDKWWYGAFGTDPSLANNTLAADTVNLAALFLQTP